MAGNVMPEPSSTLPGHSSPLALSERSFLSAHSVYFALFVLSLTWLLTDWVAQLPDERALVWGRLRRTREEPTASRTLDIWFLVSRYSALAWLLFVCAVSFAIDTGGATSACTIMRVWPQGYTIVAFAAEMTLIYRTAGIWPNQLVFRGLLALALVCLAVQIGANLFVQPMLLRSGAMTTCFLAPTSSLFAASFVASTVIHHAILAVTLVKTVRHVRATGSRLLRSLAADSVHLCLALCLSNFVSVVLVLMPSDFIYKLANQLPALVATQVFLSRMIMAGRRISAAPSSSQLSLSFPSPRVDRLELSVARHAFRRKGSNQSTFMDVSLGDAPSDLREYVDQSKIGTIPPLGPPPFHVTRRPMPTAAMPTPIHLLTPPSSPQRVVHPYRFSSDYSRRRPHTAPEWRAPDRWGSARSMPAGDETPPDPVIELREVDEVLGRALP